LQFVFCRCILYGTASILGLHGYSWRRYCRIKIDSRTFAFDGEDVLTCVSWKESANASAVSSADNQTSTTTTTTSRGRMTSSAVWQQLLVTAFINGCRPRYACVQLVKRSPSILHYRLSQSQAFSASRNTFSFDCNIIYSYIILLHCQS